MFTYTYTGTDIPGGYESITLELEVCVIPGEPTTRLAEGYPTDVWVNDVTCTSTDGGDDEVSPASETLMRLGYWWLDRWLADRNLQNDVRRDVLKQAREMDPT